VTLAASPKKGSRLAGWSGACTGPSATCDVTMDDVKMVGATFERAR
jgi:hypothetical protein